MKKLRSDSVGETSPPTSAVVQSRFTKSDPVGKVGENSRFHEMSEDLIDVPKTMVDAVTNKLHVVEFKSLTKIQLTSTQAEDVAVFCIIGTAKNRDQAKLLIKKIVGYDKWELDPYLLTIGEVTSKGPFGPIYEGVYKGIGPVAIMELNQDISRRKSFFDLTGSWRNIDHPRFVKLHGMCTFRPWYIVAESMDKGTLFSCLRGPVKPALLEMVRIAIQVCEGMEYLESRGMVHLHLSVRNVLVSGDWDVKLFEPWLYRQTTNGFYVFGDYHEIQYSRWSVPAEVSHEGRMSIKSNVWSFGCLLTDIMTFGKSPFRVNETGNAEYKMPKPEHVSQQFYDIMLACLRKNPNNRPSFANICEELRKLERGEKYDPVEAVVYNEAYRRALEHGQAVNRRIPIMIVGQDRSGKTSLRKHLQDLPFVVDEPSTCGIEVDIVELTETTAKDPWKKKKLTQFIMSEDEVNERVLKEAAYLVARQQSSPSESNQEGATATFLDEPETTELGPITAKTDQEERPLSKDMIDDIKYLEGEVDKMAAAPPITAFLHDLAGQNVYYDTHYYFLKLQCPYVVVHDLRIPFHDAAQPRFKPKLRAERNLNNPFLTTNLDHFLSWFTVLNRLREATSLGSSVEFPDFKLPPVLVALTNSDHFEGDLEEVKSHIQEILNKRGFNNVFITIYVVDNSSSGSGEDEITKLRWKLYELCSVILDKQRPVPIRWLKFEASLSKLMVAQKLSYIDFDEARRIAESCKVEDVDAAIRFLHHQGVLVHHSGSSVVVLNPTWLMNRFTEIISIPQEDKPSDASYRQLMTEGILLQEYIHALKDGKVLEQLMSHFGLICPWKHEGLPAYIVPSIAPLVQSGNDIEKQLNDSPMASLFLRFNRGHILPCVFTRFVVQTITKCAEYLRIDQPRLFCNYTLLPFQWSGQKFDVYLIEQLAAIKVGVVPANNSDCVKIARYLKNMVSQCIQGIKEDEGLFYRNMDVSVAVKCSACYGKIVPCLRHSKEQCTSDNCGHFWPIEDLLNLTEDPPCRFARVAGSVEFPLEPVMSWMGVHARKKTLQDNTKLSAKEIEMLSRHLVEHWYAVAAHLRMPHGDIINIRESNLRWSTEKDKACEMLTVFNKMRTFSRRMLVDSLREMNLNEAANELLSENLN